MYELRTRQGSLVSTHETWSDALDKMYLRATDLASKGFWQQDLANYIIVERDG